MNEQNTRESSLQDLLEQASEAAHHSNSPYSGFRAGAALRLTSGKVVTGTNVENISYELTICAERSALPPVVKVENAEKPSLRAKAYVYFESLTARLKSCPFKT
jgi:cytidine deaminase